MEKTRILLIEDEATLRLIIGETLEQEGYEVSTARDGEEGLLLLRQQTPHLVVTDIMMPHLDGFALVKELRKTHPSVPVLFLSARTGAQDVVTGFELGGNDYLKKPFGMAELLIRIKVLLNRALVPPSRIHESIRIGKYDFNPVNQSLVFNGEESSRQTLSNREAEILRRLCESNPQILEMRQLLIEFWGDDSLYNARCLHVFITKLRHKLSSDPAVSILNVRGVGYKLVIRS